LRRFDIAVSGQGRAGTFDGAMRAGLAALVLILAAPDGAAAAIRDPVPWPRLRPAYTGQATGAPLAPPGASGVDAGSAAASVARPSVDVPFRADLPFTHEQQIALANISAYFNSFRLMEGEFIQFGPGGEQAEGVFFLSRPGKIRFHFRPPARLDIISDGSSVAIRDGKARTQDMYPLSKTPLRYLLTDRIDFTSPALVNAVYVEPDTVSVVIVERSALVDGKLTLIFDRRTWELRQWVVTDAQGLNTSVAIFNTATGRPQDPNYFRIVGF
jgi:outer membrane lipoprotein-sorting protein